jgi:hypothetical protein
MADEPATQAPEETQDTPTPDAQDTSTETPDAPDTDATEQERIDYEKRYNDLQPEYTRATQEAAQLRNIFALAQQGDEEAIELLRQYIPEQDTEDEADLEEPMTQAQFQEYLAAQQQEQEAQQSEQAFMSDFAADLAEIEKKEGRSLTDWEKNVLFNDAQGQVAQTQTYDLEAPWNEISDYHKQVIEGYTKSKKQAPVAPLGSAGDQKIDLSDDDARQEYLAQVMQAEAEREA